MNYLVQFKNSFHISIKKCRVDVWRLANNLKKKTPQIFFFVLFN